MLHANVPREPAEQAFVDADRAFLDSNVRVGSGPHAPAREQRSTCRGALRHSIHAVELDATRNERVNVGRCEIAAVVANISPSKVIKYQQDQMRRFCSVFG